MAVARIENLASILRIYDDDDAGQTDPYQWCCTLRWVCPTCVELMGVTRAINEGELRALRKALLEMGVTDYVHHRISATGRKRCVNHCLVKDCPRNSER